MKGAHSITQFSESAEQHDPYVHMAEIENGGNFTAGQFGVEFEHDDLLLARGQLANKLREVGAALAK
jgi:hypothetical protein